MKTLDRVVIYSAIWLAVALAAVGIFRKQSLAPTHYPKLTNTVYVSLIYNNDDKHTCKQIVGGTEQQYPWVGQGDIVEWVAPNSAGHGQAFDVQFPSGASPFYDEYEFDSYNGHPADSSPAEGTSKKMYPYDSVSIGHNNCSNAGSLGLRMK